jgi:hypothetical protein
MFLPLNHLFRLAVPWGRLNPGNVFTFRHGGNSLSLKTKKPKKSHAQESNIRRLNHGKNFINEIGLLLQER